MLRAPALVARLFDRIAKGGGGQFDVRRRRVGREQQTVKGQGIDDQGAPDILGMARGEHQRDEAADRMANKRPAEPVRLDVGVQFGDHVLQDRLPMTLGPAGSPEARDSGVRWTR